MTDKYSISKLSELSGIDRRRLKKLLEDYKPVDRNKKSDLYTIRQLCDALQLGGFAAYDYQRTRKERALADKIEMENAVRSGELAPMELLTNALQLVASQIRSNLGGIPSQCRKRLPHLTAREIEIIQKEVVKAQNAASKIQLTEEQLS